MTVSSKKAPFYSRAYGGFTKAQEAFFLERLGNYRRKVILDPMAGQGFAISRLAHQGAHVWMGDLNPAPLLLAFLRSPQAIASRHELAAHAEGVLRRVSKRHSRLQRQMTCDDWLAPSIKADLDEYARLIGIGLFENPYHTDGSFWDSPLNVLFSAALAVLAARQLVCYRTSDNVTWLKPGGAVRESRIVAPIKAALTAWLSYAEAAAECLEDAGTLNVYRADVRTRELERFPKAHFVVTSPPYANRLDYSRMWAPESEVLSFMCGASSEKFKANQLGSTVVRGLNGTLSVESLPGFVRSALEEIKCDPAAYSSSYYYPFFLNYALSLSTALRCICNRVRSKGTVIVFVRDTARKDVMFPTNRLVSAMFRQKGQFELVDKQRHIVRHHIGFIRKNAARGLFGLAQQEWWLVFRKAT